MNRNLFRKIWSKMKFLNFKNDLVIQLYKILKKIILLLKLNKK